MLYCGAQSGPTISVTSRVLNRSDLQTEQGADTDSVLGPVELANNSIAAAYPRYDQLLKI